MNGYFEEVIQTTTQSKKNTPLIIRVQLITYFTKTFSTNCSILELSKVDTDTSILDIIHVLLPSDA